MNWTTNDVAAAVICRDAAGALSAALESVRAEGPGRVVVAWTPVGEADPTPEIVAAFAGVEILRVEEPGIAAARNAAAAAAAAEMVAVAWCDADDRWEPGKLVAQLSALADGGAWVVSHLAKPDGTYPGFTPSACLMRSEFLRQVGPWDTRFHLAADHDWMVRARAMVEPIVLPDTHVRKGIHVDNASHDRAAYRRELMRWARLQSERRP